MLCGCEMWRINIKRNQTFGHVQLLAVGGIIAKKSVCPTILMAVIFYLMQVETCMPFRQCLFGNAFSGFAKRAQRKNITVGELVKEIHAKANSDLFRNVSQQSV